MAGSANRFHNPFETFLKTSNADFLSGGTLTFYVTATTTPTDTYADEGLVTPNANPLTLNSRGEPSVDIFLDPDVIYKVVLKDADDNTIWTADPVYDPVSQAVAKFQVYAGDPNGNVAGTAGSGSTPSDVVWDTTNSILWVCTTTGTSSTAVWTDVLGTISGAIAFAGAISPTAISSNQDNYNPTGLSGATVLRLNVTSDADLTGLAGGSSGRLIIFHNIGTNVLTLKDASSSSDAANRFALGRDRTLSAGHSAILQYDAVTGRWRYLAGQELATDAETQALASTSKPVTPSNLASLVATQANQEAGTATDRFVSPGRQHFHPGHPKFWAKVTVSGGTPAIAVSHNVTSITDDDTGILTVTIATDFSSEHWCCMVAAELVDITIDIAGDVRNVSYNTMAAGTVVLQCHDNNTSPPINVDPTSWSVAGLGDQA